MKTYKLAFTAAAFASTLIISIAAQPAYSKPRKGDVVITGPRFNAATQRRVSYGDLNLVFKPDQQQLRSRIQSTADSLCGPALGYDLRDEKQEDCVGKAVISTRGQVYSAIKRAKMQLAGYAVGPALAISITVSAR